ncbi:MAG: sulfatase-like hydrolase/transferase, partial [Planctomycetota bacterium]
AAGPYGDYVVQSDWSCGQLLQALKSAGHFDNTIVVFTADNGPERYAYPRDENLDHWSAYPLRGLKRDIYEGGHRVPFLIRWPGKIEAGSVSDELVSQIDLMETLAAIVGYDLPDDAAEDSYNLLPLLDGETGVRTSHVHNTRQNQFAIRQGDWVLIDAKNGYMSGRNKPWEARRGFPENDDDPQGQLFNLAEDLGQRNNVIDEHPAKAKELRSLLTRLKNQGHSAPRLERSDP